MAYSLSDAASQVAKMFAGAPDRIVQYVKDQYANFKALGRKLTDLTHAASVLRQKALAVGNAEVAEDARQRIQFIGSLAVKHQQTINQIDNMLDTLERAEQGLLGALPVLPVAVIATATAIVAVMLYLSFHASAQEKALAAEMQIVDAVAAGRITPDQASKLITQTQAAAAAAGDTSLAGQISKSAFAIGGVLILLAIVVPKLTGRDRA